MVGTVNDANYAGQKSDTLAIKPGVATVTLGNLSQTYDGAPKSASATTVPPGLNVTLTYDGSASPPVNAKSYTVVGTVNDANYAGQKSDTFTIKPGVATVTLGNLSQTYGWSAESPAPRLSTWIERDAYLRRKCQPAGQCQELHGGGDSQ